MRIVVDENNPFAREAFSTLGTVRALPSREITRSALMDADALVCRSTLAVDAALLAGTPVRLVGTATIGTDHLDLAWLESAGIRWCNAPGCNADSVADYLTAALLLESGKQGRALEGRSLGVVGCGNVGRRVASRGRALGMRVLENDPPLQRETGEARYLPLEALFKADFLTLHTPLTREGSDPTLHLVDARLLDRLGRDTVLINTARGGVVESQALRSALSGGRLADALLDVWDGEPQPDPDLMDLAYLATPHIAGHSFDGKVRGTFLIYLRFCEWLEAPGRWDPAPLLPTPDFPEIEIDAEGREDEEALAEAVFTVYPLLEDDARFREAMSAETPSDRAAAFAALRSNYPRRREFSLTCVQLKHASAGLAAKFRGIGFQVRTVQ